MELILIRHGLPLHVETDDGAPADPPLSDEGHDQAARMAAWLREHHIDTIYTSPMRRAAETAAPLAEVKGMTAEVRDGIAEYDQDADHYIPVEKLKELDYERWRKMMRGDTEGVDFQAFCSRAINTLEDIISENAGKRVAAVCHGGVINVWTAHVIGFEPRMFFNPRYTSINRFMAASSGEKSVITLNEHHHLS